MTIIDLQIDVRGEDCPMHVLRLKYGLNRISTGQVLRVVTTVPGALADFRKYCKQTGDELLDACMDSGWFEFTIRKKT